MSYYNPHLSNYNVQNILESITGPQVYSPKKSYISVAPPISTQFRQSQIPYSDIGNRLQQSVPFKPNDSRSQLIIPVSSMSDNRVYEKPNHISSYAAPIVDLKPTPQKSQIRSDSLYNDPPQYSNQYRNYEVNGTHTLNRSFSQISQNFNRYNQQDFETRHIPMQEDKQFTQYLGTRVIDHSGQAPSSIQYGRPQFETKKFEPYPPQYQGGYAQNHFDTIQSRVIREDPNQSRFARDEPFYSRQIDEPFQSRFVRDQPFQSRLVREEPFQSRVLRDETIRSHSIHAEQNNEYMRQSFGPQTPFPPPFMLTGVGDTVLGSKALGDLPTNHIKRDQNFYHDDYITINGLGTYKKFPLKLRKNADSQNNENSGEQTFKANPRSNQQNQSQSGNQDSEQMKNFLSRI